MESRLNFFETGDHQIVDIFQKKNKLKLKCVDIAKVVNESPI